MHIFVLACMRARACIINLSDLYNLSFTERRRVGGGGGGGHTNTHNLYIDQCSLEHIYAFSTVLSFIIKTKMSNCVTM